MVALKGKNYTGADLGTGFGHNRVTQAGADGVSRPQWENLWVDGVAEIGDHVTAASNAATATAADRIATDADRRQTGLDRAATAADREQTGLDLVATTQARDDARAAAASVVGGPVVSIDGATGIVTLPTATTVVAGKVRLATSAEVMAGVVTDKAVVPADLKTRLDALPRGGASYTAGAAIAAGQAMALNSVGQAVPLVAPTPATATAITVMAVNMPGPTYYGFTAINPKTKSVAVVDWINDSARGPVGITIRYYKLVLGTYVKKASYSWNTGDDLVYSGSADPSVFGVSFLDRSPEMIVVQTQYGYGSAGLAFTPFTLADAGITKGVKAVVTTTTVYSAVMGSNGDALMAAWILSASPYNGGYGYVTVSGTTASVTWNALSSTGISTPSLVCEDWTNKRVAMRAFQSNNHYLLSLETVGATSSLYSLNLGPSTPYYYGCWDVDRNKWAFFNATSGLSLDAGLTNSATFTLSYSVSSPVAHAPGLGILTHQPTETLRLSWTGTTYAKTVLANPSGRQIVGSFFYDAAESCMVGAGAVAYFAGPVTAATFVGFAAKSAAVGEAVSSAAPGTPLAATGLTAGKTYAIAPNGAWTTLYGLAVGGYATSTTSLRVGGAARQGKRAIVTASGSWVCPWDVFAVDATVIGAGGALSVSSNSTCSSGGLVKLLALVSPGESYPVEVGAVGVQGTTGTYPRAGASSAFSGLAQGGCTYYQSTASGGFFPISGGLASGGSINAPGAPGFLVSPNSAGGSAYAPTSTYGYGSPGQSGAVILEY